MEVWRISLKDFSYSVGNTPPSWERLGGRGLIARILVDEVDPTCEPLGDNNKLIFSPGLLTGFMLSSCDRLSIGGKSPLTGGIKEANAGGTTGLKMSYLGIKTLIIEGIPEGSDWWIIHASKNGIRFEKANDLVGVGVYNTANALIKNFGNKIAISLIGQGGEMKMGAAGIQNLDKEKTPSRIAARGGLGAVMGSKRIKAIVFDSEGGEKPSLSNEIEFKNAQKEYTKALMAHPQTKIYADYGTNAMPSLSHPFGAIPTRNFSAGQFEDIEKINGDFMRDLLLSRGGESETTHACMPGCTIRCSNVYGGEDGKTIVSPLEYETVGLMGSNLGINDLDMIARLNYEVNDLGLDTIEIGAALGVAAEAGILEFGDGLRALEIIKEIKQGTALGRVIGNGAVVTGKVFGVTRIPAVKGQAMSAYEPRAIKGTGVTYATSPQGADHTAGLTIRAKVDHLDPSVQAEVSKKAQINMAGYDTLGACIFAGFGFASVPDVVRDLINARYDWHVENDFLQVIGKETIALEREFNKQAGFTKADDRIPEWMTKEPLPPNNSVFNVSKEDLDTIFDWI